MQRPSVSRMREPRRGVVPQRGLCVRLVVAGRWSSVQGGFGLPCADSIFNSKSPGGLPGARVRKPEEIYVLVGVLEW